MIGTSSHPQPDNIVVQMGYIYGEAPVYRKLTIIEFDVGGGSYGSQKFWLSV